MPMAIRRRAIPTAAAAKRASSTVRREPGGGLSPRAETIASTTPIIFDTVDVARGSRLCLSAVGLMMGYLRRHRARGGRPLDRARRAGEVPGLRRPSRGRDQAPVQPGL